MEQFFLKTLVPVLFCTAKEWGKIIDKPFFVLGIMKVPAGGLLAALIPQCCFQMEEGGGVYGGGGV